jgi:hypothetical protein
MKLFTQAQYKKLLKNGKPENEDKDNYPVIKLFTPDANATWLLVHIDNEDLDLAFGLCDLGLGFPELGYVSLSELRTVRGHIGLPVERDLHFEPKFTISVYAKAASRNERIIEDEQILAKI